MAELSTAPAASLANALIAGVAVGGLCAALGVLVVQRGLALLADGLAHASFAGIALGLVLGLTPEDSFWVALPTTCAIAIGIGFVERRTTVRADAATGIFFSVAFAAGVLLLSLRPKDAPALDLESLLFGNISAIQPGQLAFLSSVLVVASLALAATWSRLAYASFDRELALLSGVRVAPIESLLFVLTAAVVVVAVKTVGVFLVSAFLIIPAATAQLVFRSFSGVTLGAVILGTSGAAAGVFAAHLLRAPSGATIILTLGFAFFAVLLTRRGR